MACILQMTFSNSCCSFNILVFRIKFHRNLFTRVKLITPHHLSKWIHWCHNECDGISNHWQLDCLLKCLFGHKSKKTSKLCINGLCEGNSLVTGEFPTQRASDAGNVSICWRHHDKQHWYLKMYICIQELGYIWFRHLFGSMLLHHWWLSFSWSPRNKIQWN